MFRLKVILPKQKNKNIGIQHSDSFLQNGDYIIFHYYPFIRESATVKWQIMASYSGTKPIGVWGGQEARKFTIQKALFNEFGDTRHFSQKGVNAIDLSKLAPGSPKKGIFSVEDSLKFLRALTKANTITGSIGKGPKVSLAQMPPLVQMLGLPEPISVVVQSLNISVDMYGENIWGRYAPIRAYVSMNFIEILNPNIDVFSKFLEKKK